MAGLELIFKSLSRQPRLFGLWVLSLSLAVMGLVIVDVFRQSLTRTLQTEGRAILSADLSVSARRAFTDAETAAIQEVLPTGGARSEMTEMLAMISAAGTSRLANVRFVDDVYPLAGELRIENASANGDGAIASHGRDLLPDSKQAWVAPDAMTLLGLKLGDELTVGQLKFTVAGTIAKDSTQTFRFSGVTPRVYVHRRFLRDSGLIQNGSTLTQTRFALLPAGQETAVKKSLQQRLTDPGIDVTVPTDLEQGSLRVLSRLLDFLGLTGLVTLCLGWTGVFYLGRRWLTLEATPSGILKSLGFSDTELRLHLLTKLAVILTLGIACGGALAWLGAQTVLPLFKDSLPSDFLLTWSWANTFLLLLVGPVAGALLLYPPIHAMSVSPALTLVQGRTETRVSRREWMGFILTVFVLFFLVTLAQARSWRVSLIFLSSLLATVTLVAGLAWSGLKGLAVLQVRRGWRLHLTLAMWTRRKTLAALLITVSALAGLLSQLIPHLEKTLAGELEMPAGIERPGLFLIDIQDEQVTPLNDFLKSEGLVISQNAPFIRARILKVNDQEFERSQPTQWATREEETDARFRNRGVNLSYTKDFPSTNRIVAGKPWSELGTDPAEIAVEAAYAERLHLKLGDVLQFDVQGVEVRAKIASLREVEWNRFEPNFFILFRDGVLNEAPKTWITTLKSHPTLTPATIQTRLAAKFPNISSINVQETLDNVNELFGKLSRGLKLASGLCLALGLFVFLMVLLFQLSSARRDWLQLKTLGMSAGELLSLQILTYAGLCAIGLAFGSLMSLTVAWALTHFIFTSELHIAWLTMAQIFVIALGAALLGIVILAWRLNRTSSLQEILSE